MQTEYFLQNKDGVYVDLISSSYSAVIRLDPEDVVTPFGFVFTNDAMILEFLKACTRTEDLANLELFNKYMPHSLSGCFIFHILTKDNRLLELSLYKTETAPDDFYLSHRWTVIPRKQRITVMALAGFGYDRLDVFSQLSSKCTAMNTMITLETTRADIAVMADKVFTHPIRKTQTYNQLTIDEYKHMFTLDMCYFSHNGATKEKP